MLASLSSLHPIIQALLATGFTWGMTAVGAALVFLARGVNRKLLDGSLGVAAGVMIVASYWSLLAPAIAMAEASGTRPAWLPAAVGFLTTSPRGWPSAWLSEPLPPG
jgi:ZIP family zinc transporter